VLLLSYLLLFRVRFFLFFFFQAEDGIRDRNVTGVQTCALPICHLFLRADRRPSLRRSLGRGQRPLRQSLVHRQASWMDARARGRSEERRVGKECRCRWWWE